MTIKYQLPPYPILKKIINSLRNQLIDKQKNELDDHFIYSTFVYGELRYAPIKNLQQLHDRINSLIVKIDSFETAYERIVLLSSKIDENVLILVYKYDNKIDTAFAYFKPTSESQNEIGINIIPGSGDNQSSAMFYENDIEINYQSNIDDIANRIGDVFILVKPNEDFLAIHNGSKKIGSISFVNYFINNGSSYSAYYVIQSLALSKYLDNRYKSFYVCGLSQGGLAALINSLQSQPEKAVIASGFSVLMDKPYRSSHNQLIIPNFRTVYNSNGVKSQISQSNTQFLFTWGKEEAGLYWKDANEYLTKKNLDSLPNVQCYIHPEGHIYYEPIITAFLQVDK